MLAMAALEPTCLLVLGGLLPRLLAALLVQRGELRDRGGRRRTIRADRCTVGTVGTCYPSLLPPSSLTLYYSLLVLLVLRVIAR